ncbi:MAG: methionine biosynthesis protein MetW [Candidatus Omnitrophica bacterium]|nr:methionine biosynthesis protein MetW [Candidatus Omnitrophota bacterium]
MRFDSIRIDHRAIFEMVDSRSSVLDLGCGSGDLLYLLIKEKQVRGQGIDIDEEAIYRSVEKGLNALHGDIDSGLSEYRDGSFDYVILNQSLQQVRHLETVLRDALRVGRKVIVGFPNFAYYKARLQLFAGGRAPVTPSLPYTWHESPNVHFFSIRDFLGYCRSQGIRVERALYLGNNRRVTVFPNLFATSAVILVSR